MLYLLRLNIPSYLNHPRSFSLTVSHWPVSSVVHLFKHLMITRKNKNTVTKVYLGKYTMCVVSVFQSSCQLMD